MYMYMHRLANHRRKLSKKGGRGALRACLRAARRESAEARDESETRAARRGGHVRDAPAARGSFSDCFKSNR